MKLTITRIFSKAQISTRTGKPFTSLSLLTKEYGGRYLSGFASKETEGWKEGLEVELDVTESDKKDKDGKPYLNWKLPNRETAVDARINKIEFSIANIHRKIDEIVKHIKMKEDVPTHPMPTFNQRPQEEIERDHVLMKQAEQETEARYPSDINDELNALAEEEYLKL